jgi:hypothetical protein
VAMAIKIEIEIENFKNILNFRIGGLLPQNLILN